MSLFKASAIYMGIFLGLFNVQAMAEDEKDVFKGYKITGESKKCIYVSRIGSTRIIDNHTILFIQNNRKKAFVNILPRKCLGLKRFDAFGYSVRAGTLCRGDMITVFDALGGFEGATCRLGEFKKLKKIPKK